MNSDPNTHLKPYGSLPIMRVDLGAVVDNYNLLTKSTDCKIAIVIKGNAYGIGRKPVFEALYTAGCRDFFISDWQEVRDLDASMVQNSRIYALAGVEPAEQLEASDHVIPVLHREDQIVHWAKLFGRTKPCAIQIETGLQRLGLSCEKFLRDLELDIQFFVNHLACGYSPEHEMNKRQIDVALEFAARFDKPLSIASSCGFLLDFTGSAHMFRIGRLIYGIVPRKFRSHEVFSKIRTVATLEAPLISIRSIKKGDSVGYDRQFIADRDMNIGVLNIGYSSGYYFVYPDQKVFAKGHFSGEHFYKIISQSMDFLMIDITDGVFEIGQYFELFGANISQDDPVNQSNLSLSRLFLPGHMNIVRVYHDAQSNITQDEAMNTTRESV